VASAKTILASPDCRICSAGTELFGSATVLGKFPVCYFKCSRCGFIQTEEPYWLDEAYNSAITASDIGYVSRNLSQASLTEALIQVFFRPEKRFLDFGGGYGLFVRILRDRGFDYYRYDEFCTNVFATGFDVSGSNLSAEGEGYDLLTAFEVFEHLERPHHELEKMLALSKNILFSTVLLPGEPPPIGQWWYYGLEHGQHVSFYTSAALAELASHYGLHFVTDGNSLHLFSQCRVSPPLFRFILRHRKLVWLINKLRARQSLLPRDFDDLTTTAANQR
jgi:hypothetical protein